MAWYSAHIVTYVKFTSGVQDKFPVWENVVLIDAQSVDDAYEQAERLGKEDYDGTIEGSGGLLWEGRPAVWVFAGIRKLIECQDTATTMISRSNGGITPISGTEVTYSEMEVESEDALLKLVNGEPVIVHYKM